MGAHVLTLRVSVPTVLACVLLPLLPRSAISADVQDLHNRIQSSRARGGDDEDAKAKAVRITRATPVGKGDAAKIAEFRERGEKERLARVKEVTKRANRMASAAKELKELKASKGKYLPCLGEPAAGASGMVQHPDQSLLPTKVLQVTGETEALVELGEKPTWLKGFGLKGVVDGQYVLIECPVAVTGTKTYATTNGGSKTVFVVEPFDLPKSDR